jgi:hypothetical protein
MPKIKIFAVAFDDEYGTTATAFRAEEEANEVVVDWLMDRIDVESVAYPLAGFNPVGDCGGVPVDALERTAFEALHDALAAGQIDWTDLNDHKTEFMDTVTFDAAEIVLTWRDLFRIAFDALRGKATTLTTLTTN